MVDAETSSVQAVTGHECAALVDARGLSCPMPLLKAKLALNHCQVGESVQVYATDAGSVRDFHSFAELSAHSLAAFYEHEGYFEYVLQKGEVA